MRTIWSSAHDKLHAYICGCGVEFESPSTQAKYCPSCRQRRAAENQAASRERQLERFDKKGWPGQNISGRHFEVLYDPTGDFRKGARLGAQDLQYSLELGVLPTGMWFRDVRCGKFLVVVQDKGHFRAEHHARAPRKFGGLLQERIA